MNSTSKSNTTITTTPTTSYQLQYEISELSPEKINGKNVLITGGTGSFGHKMVETLLKHFQLNRLVIYSRDEFKQANMKVLFSPKKYPFLRYFIGDIRDYERLESALRGIDIVFHASALKRIQECEYEPMEAIKTNILGTNNLIRACIKMGVSTVIGLSTDKACSPVNLYGATKLCAEKLLINGNLMAPPSGTKFAVCRYGNIMGSRGSLFQIFEEQLKANQPLTVTDPEMTRFTMLQEEAVNFVLSCLDKLIGGEIFIPKLPSYSIEQVVRCFNQTLDKCIIMGSRAGEKTHEAMISQDESLTTYEFDKFFILAPLEEYELKHFKIEEYARAGYKYKKLPPSSAYTSKEAKKLSDEVLTQLIFSQSK